MQSAYWNIEVTPSSFFPPPHSGILFFIVRKYETNNPNDLAFPSPYSGILFLWENVMSKSLTAFTGFRPLIRGFFFIGSVTLDMDVVRKKFPSPHSGILFLWRLQGWWCLLSHRLVSVPSFGDSFFIGLLNEPVKSTVTVVSVPSFGDSFFIWRHRRIKSCYEAVVSVPSFGDSFFMMASAFSVPSVTPWVSVPSFGDSFFICHLKSTNATADGSFRPLIRGFFFYTLN